MSKKYNELLTTSGTILKRLDLADTNISDAALVGVQLPKLEMLFLDGCSNLTDTGVHELLTTNPFYIVTLTTLNVQEILTLNYS